MRPHVDSRGASPACRCAIRLRVVGAAVLVMACLGAPLTATSPAPGRARKATNARLIYAGWFYVAAANSPLPTPDWLSVAANRNFMETQPFDGMALYLMNGSLNVTQAVQKSTALSYAQVLGSMDAIEGITFTNLTDNFALIQGSTPPDFFDSWVATVQNWQYAARAAKQVGLKGIIFDNEQYASPWGNYGSHLKYYGSKTKQQYLDQARLRGREVMDAMIEEFPDISVLTLHGPYISQEGTSYDAGFDPGWQSGNEMMGPFFAGKMEAAVGTSAVVVDGGESYRLRSRSDFDGHANYRRNTLPQNCPFITPELAEVWPDQISISFGVYDKPWQDTPMSADILRPTLTNALEVADHYVWFYAEANTYLEPTGTAQSPPEWLDAIRDARAAAGVGASQGPLGTPTNLSGNAVSTTEVFLTWEDHATAETGFNIERHNGGSFAPVTTVGANMTSYTNTGLSAGTTYTYRVRATDGSANSNWSNPFTVTTPATGGAPAAPSNLAVTGVTESTVSMSWTDNSSNENGFSIERQDGSAWTEVGTTEANDPGFTVTGLSSITTYTFRVIAYNGSGSSGPSNQIIATTTAPGMVPSAPGNLAAGTATSSTVALSWTDNSFNEEGFIIEKMPTGGSWSLAGTAPMDSTAGTATGLTASTQYSFRVMAFNGQGNSAASNTVSATTSASSGVPSAPTNLIGNATSEMTISLSWTDNSSDENGFAIERLIGGTWTQVGWVTANVTTTIEGGLSPNTSYSYRVCAANGSGSSARTNEVTVTTWASSGGPTPPSNLVVGTVTEMMFTITWNDNSSNETGFRIERYSGGVWSQYDWRTSNTTSFTAGGLPPNTQYVLRVVAYNEAGNSAPTNQVTLTTSAGSGVPPAPSNLAVGSVTSSTVTMSWTDNSSNENGFSIERIKNGAWAQTGWVPANTTTFTKTGLVASTEYSFRVRAFNGNGNSPVSNAVNAMTSAPPAPPAAPSNLAQTFATSSTITLSWTDGSNNEDGFSIQKYVNDVWSQTGSVPANTTTFTKTGLPSGTGYTYRVVAFNGGGSSPPSDWIGAMTSASGSPTAPSNLAVTGVTSSSVSLSWTDNSNNENGFSVQKKLGGGTWEPVLPSASANATTYQVTGLSPNTQYSFRVYAFNSGGSWYTNVVTPTTSP